jgi:hypothetical protein
VVLARKFDLLMDIGELVEGQEDLKYIFEYQQDKVRKR